MAESKKPKTKAKAKSRTRAKPKPKVVPPPVQGPDPVPEPLTKAEEFYIDNNSSLTDLELAADLGKPLPTVRQHIHKTLGQSRINKLLIREKGCVIMTEGASMEGDNSRKGYVSEQSIRAAVAEGNYEEAARLQAIMKTQLRGTSEEAAKRQESYIHRILK